MGHSIFAQVEIDRTVTNQEMAAAPAAAQRNWADFRAWGIGLPRARKEDNKTNRRSRTINTKYETYRTNTTR